MWLKLKVSLLWWNNQPRCVTFIRRSSLGVYIILHLLYLWVGDVWERSFEFGCDELVYCLNYSICSSGFPLVRKKVVKFKEILIHQIMGHGIWYHLISIFENWRSLKSPSHSSLTQLDVRRVSNTRKSLLNSKESPGITTRSLNKKINKK